MRFTVRDLLFVTVIVAMAIGWWLDRSKLQRQVEDTDQDFAASKVVLKELIKDMDTIHPGWRGAKWSGDIP